MTSVSLLLKSEFGTCFLLFFKVAAVSSLFENLERSCLSCSSSKSNVFTIYLLTNFMLIIKCVLRFKIIGLGRSGAREGGTARKGGRID